MMVLHNREARYSTHTEGARTLLHTPLVTCSVYPATKARPAHNTRCPSRPPGVTATPPQAIDEVLEEYAQTLEQRKEEALKIVQVCDSVGDALHPVAPLTSFAPRERLDWYRPACVQGSWVTVSFGQRPLGRSLADHWTAFGWNGRGW